MSLVRKVRKVGSSLVITIPRQLAEAYDIKEGVFMEISVVRDRLVLKVKRGD